MRGTVAGGVVRRPGIAKRLGEEKVRVGCNHIKYALLMFLYPAPENTACRNAA